ncbi:MAG TPA: ABC transporter permease, partial [Terriglobales bacterium]|nr:ABC transporter permease [Terriglobales bacterium]
MRILRKAPGFAAVAIATLALGIGLTSAVFSAVYGILLNPLPYPRADRLVMVWERVNLPSYNSDRTDPTPGDFTEWNRTNTAFDDLAAIRYRSFAVTDGGEPQQVEGEAVSWSMFSVLNVVPALGRAFTEGEDRSQAKVAVIANDLWVSRFGSNPAIVGQTVRLDGEAYTVLGVMPRGFHFPDPDD